MNATSPMSGGDGLAWLHRAGAGVLVLRDVGHRGVLVAGGGIIWDVRLSGEELEGGELEGAGLMGRGRGVVRQRELAMIGRGSPDHRLRTHGAWERRRQFGVRGD